MQALLILVTVFLITISDSFCGRLDKLQRGIRYACPHPEEIPKCQCKLAFGGLSITCEGIKADSELQSILKTLEEYTLKDFTITNYNASSISTDLWKGQDIESLSLNSVEVDDTSLSRKGKRHFQGLENSLDTLSIDKSFKTAHRPLLHLQLDHLKKLKNAIFLNNNIPEVGNDWFSSGPKEMSILFFENNGIIELGNEAFSSLSNLSYLSVAGNYFGAILRSMLPKSATFLKYLNLSKNKITTLPNDIFSGMPALEDVDLNYNFIQTIEEHTFKTTAPHIKWLHLEGNPLDCGPKIKWACNTHFKGAIGTNCSSPNHYKGWTLRRVCSWEREFD